MSVPCCVCAPHLDHGGMPCWNCWTETRAKLARAEVERDGARATLERFAAHTDRFVAQIARAALDEAKQ